MPKKASKKPSKKAQANSQKKLIKKSSQSKKKLGPGKKQCKNCRFVMPIHTKICTKCQHVHQMKKKKEDIMKNLNKITPIVIKSIIQNKDFNKFVPWSTQSESFSIGTLNQIQPQKQPSSQTQFLAPASNSNTNSNINLGRTKSQQKVPKSLPKRRSTPASTSTPAPDKSTNNFKQTNNEMVQYMALGQGRNICCMATSKYWLGFVQSIEKQATELQQKQQLTIKAYSLHNFNLVGVKYTGESILHFAYSPPELTNLNQLTFHKIHLKYHVLKIKIFANLVMILTGLGTVLVFCLTVHGKSNRQTCYTLSDKVEIVQPEPDRITACQFLRSTAKTKQKQHEQQILIVTGTQYGRMSIYKITKTGHIILRYIPNAHRQMVTCIAQCPMNTFDEGYKSSQEQQQQQQQKQDRKSVLFTSSSYDGSVLIWDVYEHRPIFEYECSNRKIWSVFWDPGNKYLMVNRDEIVDPCVILCFYSINKIENTVNFANSVEIRTVKTQRCVTIIHHDYYSERLPVLDPISGILKLLQIQQLRGSSLKKKKIKKDERLQKVYRIGWKQGHVPVVQEISQSQQADNIKNKHKDKDKQQGKKAFPMFSDLCIQNKNGMEFVYLTGYNGTLVVLKNIVKNQ